ncbi:MAG: hypothetical protein GTO51_06505 [Candidatus Latescibacteria bacterium]|nr:hypothetical protein [Candidatus Latescibacterota bacterium]NIM65624.1 hypothetical protein [Candidatus Latescibacterota bacterium]NIO28817.1 hypothetical protein [Candidatus Latescibacterota bacterium]NIO56442.1 hypothetical protein [Candidatus Latescibacterota bacterium]NIO77647.1 hypothetical protein [Candidatus Latescibacterota bacterium]
METPIERHPHHTIFRIQLENDKGLEVNGLIKIPEPASGPYPALVLLGGLRTGERVIDYIENSGDVVLMALDYPYEGERENLSTLAFLLKIPAIRRAIFNTVPCALLAIDYLAQRADIDRERIIIVGGSVGALFVPAIASVEPRIAAAALLFGAGDLQSLLYANIEMAPPIAGIACWGGSVLASPVEPLKYIDKISPRPLFMLNGIDDPRIPEQCSLLLHEKAKHPKTIRWISSGHLHVRTEAFQREVRRELEIWLVQNHFVSPDDFRKGPIRYEQ